MKTELEYYDIFPKVLRAGEAAEINIKPLGGHVAFKSEKRYRVQILPMDETFLNEPRSCPACPAYTLDNGTLRFSYHFAGEQIYNVQLSRKENEDWLPLCELKLYALEPDLFALRPFVGDMHCHTHYSDGKEAPAIVAANYRRAGFDFLSITDHEQYQPSIEAIDAYRDLALSFKLFPGEEVHPPGNNTHSVHFAGDNSVNEIFQRNPEKYEWEVDEIEKDLELPDGINRREYASLLWVYKNIHEVGGMSIMVHPCWIQDGAYHVRNVMFKYLMRTSPFDAFELTGGLSMDENQSQIAMWQQIRAEGHHVPIVGNSDSHGTVNAEWFCNSKTMVLAKSCTREGIVKAVKSRRSVVLEQYHGETQPRIYGEYRIVEFVRFLVSEYMPLHDDLCYEEGRLMKDFACGDKEAGDLLNQIGRRAEKLTEKYWAK